jgi:DNA-directed RNA polymerase subunit F
MQMENFEFTKEKIAALDNTKRRELFEDWRQRLGNEDVEVKIGNVIIRNREDLQAWQIENGYSF